MRYPAPAFAADARSARPYRYWGVALFLATASAWLVMIGAAKLIAELV